MISKEVHLFLTTECNLNCKYCFVKNNCTLEEHMDINIVDSIMEYICHVLPEGVIIQFFGGEPLLKFDIIKDIVTKYPTLAYSMATNFTLMDDDKFSFLKEHRDAFLVTLSIDGAMDSQVSNRGALLDTDKIRKAIRELRTSIRMVVVEPNNLYEDVKFLASLGNNQINIAIPSFYKNRINYKEDIIKQLELVTSDVGLTGRVTLPKLTGNPEHCRAAISEICIAPNGDIFPCDIFYLKREFRIGDVVGGIDSDKVKEFKDAMRTSCHSKVPCNAHRYYMKDTWIN